MRHRLMLVWLLLGLVCSPAWAVPSKQFTAPGTALVFADSGQAGVVASTTMTFTALASGAGRVSARYDKGTGSQPSLWEMRCRVALTGTNVVGTDVQFFIATSDGTDVDGGVGTADAAIAIDQRRDLYFVGSLMVSQTATNVVMFASFRNIYIPNRFFSVAVWNNTSLPLQTSTTAHRCTMTPMPPEMQ